MKTEELIVRLVQSASPVRPLAPPMWRLGRWTAGAMAVTVLGVVIIGTRPDLRAMVGQVSFATIAAATLATALLSAAAAFVLSVPGAERSPVQRWTPVAAAGAWAGLLAISILSGGRVGVGDPWLFHAACVIQIAGLAVIPGWMLFAMVRRAAPLERRWSSGLAMLAAVALAAVGTQCICPIDDPLHLLVGHFVPVGALALGGALVGTRAIAAPDLTMP